MFSVILPTIWKSERIFNLLDKLNKYPLIDEVILIDNSNQFIEKYNKPLEKIKVITPETNLYVNPSWNLGVKEAKNDLICFLNDDIDFNFSVFDYIMSVKDQLGLIGQHKDSYSSSIGIEDEQTFNLVETHSREWGWGCLVFGKKDNWIEIPDQLKIWCGDDFIFNKTSQKKFYIQGISIKTEMSTSSDLGEFDAVRKADMEYYKQL